MHRGENQVRERSDSSVIWHKVINHSVTSKHCNMKNRQRKLRTLAHFMETSRGSERREGVTWVRANLHKHTVTPLGCRPEGFQRSNQTKLQPKKDNLKRGCKNSNLSERTYSMYGLKHLVLSKIARVRLLGEGDASGLMMRYYHNTQVLIWFNWDS